MTDQSKAVFLSYASQDAEAAENLSGALRVAGIEVWLDKSELRGGDAWDQNIRQQIRDCTLFLPIISRNTQSREEGYFRLEWRLADQRTHLMGAVGHFLCRSASTPHQKRMPTFRTRSQQCNGPGCPRACQPPNSSRGLGSCSTRRQPTVLPRGRRSLRRRNFRARGGGG
ncbi:MAG: toll/interleukin-1 receptor domain-containing protein [Sulfuricaulis sp.]